MSFSDHFEAGLYRIVVEDVRYGGPSSGHGTKAMTVYGEVTINID